MSVRALAVAAVASACVVASARSEAQRTDRRVERSVDAGGTSVRYADSVRSSAITLAPAFQIGGDRSTFALSGSLSQFLAGGWSLQSAFGASAYSRSVGALAGELTLNGGGSVHGDGSKTAQSLGVARAHLMFRERGAWLGAGLGSAWDGAQGRRLRLAEIGGWSRLGKQGSALIVGTPTVVGDGIRYMDLALSARWTSSRAEMGASWGSRHGGSLPIQSGDDDWWGSASGIVWLTRRVGLVAGLGSYPIDYTQGFPGGRFVSLAVRVGTSPPGARNGSRTADSEVAERRTSAITGFETLRATGGSYRFRVRVSQARRVELHGDFTAWKPMALSRGADGWWTVVLPVSSGVHQLNIRLDGGAWLVPPGLMLVRDEFGGEVGLLTVR